MSPDWWDPQNLALGPANRHLLSIKTMTYNTVLCSAGGIQVISIPLLNPTGTDHISRHDFIVAAVDTLSRISPRCG
ncbi:MAG: hypothetical protein M3P28_04660 [Thermoproteota archaeon]|nr:hypothetical protein [Thermoproteota archaeon]